MSRTPRQTRVASDFSIARILADDSGEKKLRSSVFAESVESLGDVAGLTLRPGGRGENDGFRSFAERECGHAIGSFALHADRVCHPALVGLGTTAGDARDERTSGRENSRESPELGTARYERGELSWLQCTRYRPPKIPRKTVTGKSGKRRPGAHPRIPFTATQLQVLEDKYRRTAYLSRRDVVQLSTALRLPQSRVKIWFQNRRARDRRESTAAASNSTTSSADDRTRDAPDGETTTSRPV